MEDLMRNQADGYNPDLHAALDHLLASGGKRVRPTITFLIGHLFNAPSERLITLAAAIELLHTATLVHDDLIDGSLLRRGIPTLNAQWSPGATVLTGDFLFATAAKLAADTNSVSVMKLFAKTLTIIVNGEINQLFGQRYLVDRNDYYRRIYAKTASLFETSASAAALISDCDPQIVECARRFGYEIGMAFQIVDDVLDFTGEQATIGKPVGSDLRQGLVTLPVIIYVEKHPDDPNSQTLLKSNGLDDQQLLTFLERLRSSDAIQASMEEARQFVKRGLAALECLPESEERSNLAELAQYFVQRDL
jgi:geranylgeranyl pyrophosphate synthase